MSPGTTTAWTAGALLAIALSVPSAAQNSPNLSAWSRTVALDESQGTAEERGRAQFNNWCSACHSRDASNAPGTQSLQVKYQGSLPAPLEDREDLTVDFVKFFVRNGVATMPFFRPTEIGDAELEALASYLAD